MNVTPWLRSPITDITASPLGNQWGGKCADLELDAVECLEAYGFIKGLKKCDVLLKDFRECQFKAKQFQRHFAMKDERERQFQAGERTRENRYASPPKPDSFSPGF